MPQTLYPPARAQTLGEVLKTGAQIFRLSFNASLPYAIIAAACGELANLRNLSLDLPVQTIRSEDPEWWAWYIAGFILALLFVGALILRQKALAAGERSSVVAELRQAGVLLSRLIACVALCIVAVTIALLPVSLALPMTGLNPAAPDLASVKVGMLLVLIPLSLPGAVVSLGLFFALPLLLVKKLGPMEAMHGSFRLLRGNWWRTSVLTAAMMGVLILMLILVSMFGIAAAAVTMAGVTDLRVMSTLAVPLEIAYGALAASWCSAQTLAMMGDLMVRQEESRRAAGGAGPSLK